MTVGLWSAVGSVTLFAFAVALFIVTWVQVSRSVGLTPVTKVVWVAAAFAYPLVGPAVWFWYGKRDAERAEPVARDG